MRRRRTSGRASTPIFLSVLVLGASAATTFPVAPDVALSQAPPQAVVIEEPVDGARTNRREVTVRGSVSGVPAGAEVVVTVRVDRRPVELYVDDSDFRTRVAVEVGRNDISAKAEIYLAEDENGERPIVLRAPPLVVTREVIPGDATGTLDRATASLVTSFSRDVYWLCGEGDGCTVTQPVCVEMSRRRVDCAVGHWWEDEPRRCGLVTTVRLRGRRLYHWSYDCRGRWSAEHARRYLRRAVYRKGRQFRVNLRGAGWLRAEINDPNRYGVPRFDPERDVFLP